MTAQPAILHDYWRSSASYRVRIALNLLAIPYESRTVDLLQGDHRQEAYLALNPQGIVPSLEIGGKVLTQSLAIIEYLHATTGHSALLPDDPHGQYRVRQLSYAIAMEIHPVCNLSVATHMAGLTGGDEMTKAAWMQHFIAKGLAALEGLLQQGDAGTCCAGDTPSMADCCLIPQLYNADRWGVSYERHERIRRIADNLHRIDAFRDAHPDRVGPPAR
ncbi:maleylacetoacetate isomerase [Tritonibacter mobilis]|nr:maleylacetoacetate isomerase [Tritonibacter mobilis]